MSSLPVGEVRESRAKAAEHGEFLSGSFEGHTQAIPASDCRRVLAASFGQRFVLGFRCERQRNQSDQENGTHRDSCVAK